MGPKATKQPHTPVYDYVLVSDSHEVRATKTLAHVAPYLVDQMILNSPSPPNSLLTSTYPGGFWLHPSSYK